MSYNAKPFDVFVLFLFSFYSVCYTLPYFKFVILQSKQENMKAYLILKNFNSGK